MSNLSMVEAKLPPGFRFHPKDSELICDYLMNKVTHSNHPPLPLLIQVDLNNCEPWDIPETACVGSKEWYFYSHRDRKYASGVRTNRATTSGYWKATGKDRPIIGGGTLGLVGMRKTLVFYQGRAPKGTKTDWVMHEFRLEGPLGPPDLPSSKEDLVLCRVFNKNKEAPAKQCIEINYDDTSSSTSLMEPYITYDQTQAKNNNNQYEQVPCFSNFTQYQTNPTFSHITHMDPIIPTKSTAPTFGVMPKLSEYSNPPSCEKMVIKAVLNHLNKVDGNPPNMKGSIFEEGSSESFLSEVGLHNIWNYYGF